MPQISRNVNGIGNLDRVIPILKPFQVSRGLTGLIIVPDTSNSWNVLDPQNRTVENGNGKPRIVSLPRPVFY